MYARGMSIREIQGHLRELYGLEVSRAEAALLGLEPGRERMDHARQGMALGEGSVCRALRRALHAGRGLNVNPPLPARNP